MTDFSPLYRLHWGFRKVQQSAGDVTHIYLSLDHPAVGEGVLHCYFQSLGCTHKGKRGGYRYLTQSNILIPLGVFVFFGSLHKECVALELLAKYCGSGENGTKAENHEHTKHTEHTEHTTPTEQNRETTDVDGNAAITEEEDATTAKEALPHRIVVQLQRSSYVELTKFVQRTSKEQLLLTRSANDVRNQAPMNKALVALMTRMVLSVREYATHLLVAKGNCSVLLILEDFCRFLTHFF